MHYIYKTKDTCASEITFDIENGIISNLEFKGGCNGNLKAIPILVNGMAATDVAKKLKGVSCGGRYTSCADQLSNAIESALTGDLK